MGSTTLSSRAFNQDASKAKKAAAGGPVFITDRGRPAHVLLTIEDYHRLLGGGASIVDLLSGDAQAGDDFEVPLVSGAWVRPADLG